MTSFIPYFALPVMSDSRNISERVLFSSMAQTKLCTPSHPHPATQTASKALGSNPSPWRTKEENKLRCCHFKFKAEAEGRYEYAPEIAIYAPKISTAPYVMVFLGADAFSRGSGRGLNPGN